MKLPTCLLLLVLISSIQHQVSSSGGQMNITTNGMDATDLQTMAENNTLLPDYDTIISEEFLQYLNINFVVTGIYLPLLLSVGIVGNSLTVVLLYRGVLKSASSIYLVGLSISDLLYLIASIPWVFTAHPILTETVAWKAVYSYYITYVFPVIFTQFTTSVWIIVAFTVERLVVVAVPLKAKQSSAKRPKIIVGLIYLLGICFNIPRYLVYTVTNKVDPVTGEEYLAPDITNIGGNPSFIATIFWLSFVFNIVLPLLIIAALNIAIVVKLGKARQETLCLNSTLNRNSRDDQITRLLFAIVVAFIVCNAPSAVLNVMAAVAGQRLLDLTYRIMLLFATTLMTTNTVVNFICYASCSSAMRHALRDMLCKLRLRQS